MSYSVFLLYFPYFTRCCTRLCIVKIDIQIFVSMQIFISIRRRFTSMGVSLIQASMRVRWRKSMLQDFHSLLFFFFFFKLRIIFTTTRQIMGKSRIRFRVQQSKPSSRNELKNMAGGDDCEQQTTRSTLQPRDRKTICQ